MTTSVDSEVAGTAGFDGTLSGGTLVLTDTYLTRYAAKQVMISGDGTGATTNAGIIAGYYGSSGYGAIWPSTVTPSLLNFSLALSAASTTIGASGTGTVNVQANGAGTVLARFGGTSTGTYTAGAGLQLIAGTATTDVNALNVTQTWNNAAVAFTGFELNVTDTTSNAASKLLDLQVGGTSKFSVQKDGTIYAANQITGASNVVVQGGVYADGSAGFYGRTNTAVLALGTSSDTILARDAANTLALRNSTNAQTFNIYNTYTDASNYERLALTWESNVLKYDIQKAGTGTQREFGFYRGGVYQFGTSTDGISCGRVRLGETAPGGTTANVILDASSSAVFKVWNGNATSGACLEMLEQTAPSAPATNSVRIYAEDDGAGKTRLMALFATGAAQQIAIEP